jgi:hypothetical protein
MGTRNLTKVIDKDGVIKVAQYGQWDGYPSGQGLNALYHAHNHALIESKLKLCHFLDQDGIDHINAGFTDKTDISFEYPNLSRDTCADILGYVAFALPYDGEIQLVDQRDFENEGMCEGVYTLDFQQRKFISKYHGKTVEFSLDYLPDKATYLLAWE